MAEDELLGMISPRAIRDIKREDPTPIFKAFIVGQEGEARPKVLGLGATVQRWYYSAIEKLTEKLALGTPAYHNHAADNGPAGRQPIGEIVGKAFKKLGEVASSIAVAYIYPPFRDLSLDIASIEADILAPSADVKDFAVRDLDVLGVSGIAFGNSALNSPAFPGATLLAQVQAFAEQSVSIQGGNEKMLTAEQIKAAIAEGKFKPSDLFPSRELVLDPIVVELVDEKTHDLRGFQIRKLKDADDKVASLSKENEELKGKMKTYESKETKGRAREVFDAAIAERPKVKGDDRLLKFLNDNYERGFNPPDDAGKLKDEINKFLDERVQKFEEIVGKPAGGNGAGSGSSGSGAAGDAGGGTGSADVSKNLQDPKNNDLIPTD
jgi:uncharacterized protein YdcH (DUF465 family)